jgi:transposase
MIRPGFLDSESRDDLIELARDGLAEHRLARRAKALVLLDNGMSCQSVAEVLLLDNDTIRTWYQLYQEDGVEGLASFGHEGGSCRLAVEQQDKLKAWITETLPRSTRAVGAWIARECGIEYQTRSGLIALLHRPRLRTRGFSHHVSASFPAAVRDGSGRTAPCHVGR